LVRRKHSEKQVSRYKAVRGLGGFSGDSSREVKLTIPYEIKSQLGAGGMGEVYLAQDTKLDRKVGLKILPADVAANRDRMDRFVREVNRHGRMALHFEKQYEEIVEATLGNSAATLGSGKRSRFFGTASER
jgi:serine/threonine protein kinase